MTLGSPPGFRFSLGLPFVARMRIGRGFDRFKSHNGSSAFLAANSGLEVIPYETDLNMRLLRIYFLGREGEVIRLFCVKCIEPWFFLRGSSSSDASRLKN